MLRNLFLIFGASCLLSLFVNWAVRGLTRRIGLVDRADGHRKLQSHAVPLAGGIAIFTVILVVVAGLAAFSPDWRSVVLSHGLLGIGLAISGSLIVGLGVIDDAVGLRGRQKLAGQIVAAGVLVICGLSIDRVQVLNWYFDLGVLSVPLTIFWLVGAMNAMNLLDGIDGLAGTIGLVLSATLAVMAFMTGHETIALVATIMTGSLIGFLRFNLPPATMYLGDAGSMLIGLAVGAMAIRASLKGPGTVLLAVPLALWTIPIFDTAAAILRRKLTGRSIYTTDRAHLHHRLVERVGHRMTLVCVAAVSLLTASAALLSVWWKHDLIAIVCGGVVVVVFVSLRVFGHSELLLAFGRLRGLLRSIILIQPLKTDAVWNEAIRLQGSRRWEVLWETLTEYAAKFGFVELRLDVNVPILGEGYHATWKSSNRCDPVRYWRFDMPLMADDRVLGYIKVVGERGGATGHNLDQLTGLMEQLEAHLILLLKPNSTVSELDPENRAASAVTQEISTRDTILDLELDIEMISVHDDLDDVENSLADRSDNGLEHNSLAAGGAARR